MGTARPSPQGRKHQGQREESQPPLPALTTQRVRPLDMAQQLRRRRRHHRCPRSPCAQPHHTQWAVWHSAEPEASGWTPTARGIDSASDPACQGCGHGSGARHHHQYQRRHEHEDRRCLWWRASLRRRRRQTLPSDRRPALTRQEASQKAAAPHRPEQQAKQRPALKRQMAAEAVSTVWRRGPPAIPPPTRYAPTGPRRELPQARHHHRRRQCSAARQAGCGPA